MSYWKDRQHYPYYAKVREWLEELGPQGSICDVGAKDTPIANYGTFTERWIVDDDTVPPIPGITAIIKADWYKWVPPHRFDVITCLQVLEHVEDPRTFAEKIFQWTHTAIISVPYKWEPDKEGHHKHHHIDVRKFVEMTGRDPIRLEIIGTRIIGLWQD